MQSIQDLRAELTRLEGLAAEIRSQGTAIQDPSFWFDTARNQAKVTYYRKRWFENGRKRSEVISKEKYDGLKAAIARGKELTRIETEIRKVQQQLDWISEKAVELGLELPAG